MCLIIINTKCALYLVANYIPFYEGDRYSEIKAWKENNVDFPASWAKFLSSRVDFPPDWKGFPYVFLYLFSPNYKFTGKELPFAPPFACYL